MSEFDWKDKFATRSSRMRKSEIRELLSLMSLPEVISFGGGIPDSSLFPHTDFKKAYDQILTDEPQAALQYSMSEGYPPLREWIASQMNSIGIPCNLENIIITSGSQQALDYLGKLFISPGEIALTADPTYLGALLAFNAYEPVYYPLSLAENSSYHEYKAVEKSIGKKIKLAYISSDFSNPTGKTIDEKTRENLLDVLERIDVPLIEDGAYQSLRFHGESIPPIIALSIKRKGHINNTRIIYSGSFSKTLAPGLRIGWICANAELIKNLVLIKQASDLHSPTINQMVINHVVRHQSKDHIEKIRKLYGRRCDCMLDALSKYMPKTAKWSKPNGGMFIWLTLADCIDTTKLLATSLKTEKVAFVPGRAFFANKAQSSSLRLSFSCTDETVIEKGIQKLGRLIAKEESRSANQK